MYGYTPFDRPIDELTAADLISLKSVPEGWYIEYKRELPSAKSIAKSLSAFANTYGGWLFYGIAESADGSRVAGAFPGVAQKDIAQLEQNIRQAAAQQISPTPSFEIKVLVGPNRDLGLAEDKAIIAVGIPAGNQAPYVHGTGLIYRRVADSSEPKPETDRHFLDLLWNRRQGVRKAFKRFIRQAPSMSEREEGMSAIRFCFLPDPWGERHLRATINFDAFASLMSSGLPEDGGIPFDTFQSTANGFIARQVGNSNAGSTVLSWRLYQDGTNEVIVPLSSSQIRSTRDAVNFIGAYKHSSGVIRQIDSSNSNGFSIIDLCQLYAAFLGIFVRTRVILDASDIKLDKLFCKVQLHNVWRRMPYVDLEETAAFMSKFGLPIIQEKTLYFPPGYDPDDCFVFPLSTDVGEKSTQTIGNAAVMFLFVCSAMGLPSSAIGMGTDDLAKEEGDILQRLTDLNDRGAEVNDRRRGTQKN